MIARAGRQIRALVVGLGSMGRRHLANLRKLLPQADITVLRHQRHSESCAEDADRTIHDLEDALRLRPDLAIVATPAPFHLQAASALAEQGVHLLVEKPLSDSLVGIDELIETCRGNESVLLVGYNLRYYRPLTILQEAIDDGRVGRVLSLRAEVGQYLPAWRQGRDYRQGVSARAELGGGVLLELSHELDYARWLLGEVALVSAQTGCLSGLEIDVEDVAELTLRFENQAIGNLHLNMFQQPTTRGCRIIGTGGTLAWDGCTHAVDYFDATSETWQSLLPAEEFDRNSMFVDELEHFFQCIDGSATPRVTGTDGKRTLQLVLAAKQSARKGMAVEIEK